MIKKKDFLKEYNIEKETLKKTGMKWEELNSIYDSYCRLEPQLKKIGGTGLIAYIIAAVIMPLNPDEE